MPRNPVNVYNYTEPDWYPLERAVCLAGLPIETTGEFMWMCENPRGTHQYKHRDTRKYAHLTATTTPVHCIQDLALARGDTSDLSANRVIFRAACCGEEFTSAAALEAFLLHHDCPNRIERIYSDYEEVGETGAECREADYNG